MTNNLHDILRKLNFVLIKGDAQNMPYHIKDDFRVLFSEYDYKNFYIPIGNSLFWTNDIDEILQHYEKSIAKKT